MWIIGYCFATMELRTFFAEHALPVKAAQHHSISNLTSFGVSDLAADKTNAVSF